MPWQLVQYDGAFDQLLASLTEDQKDSIRPRLTQLWQKGNLATFPITEPLGGGLFEVRGRSKKVRIRLLFGFLPGQRIVFVWVAKRISGNCHQPLSQPPGNYLQKSSHPQRR